MFNVNNINKSVRLVVNSILTHKSLVGQACYDRHDIFSKSFPG